MKLKIQSIKNYFKSKKDRGLEPIFFEKIREMTTKSAKIISNILPNPKEVYDER